jgi:hypothetical protein
MTLVAKYVHINTKKSQKRGLVTESCICGSFMKIGLVTVILFSDT